MMKSENIAQSPWIAEIYNKYFDNITNGFFVEIGVGDTVNWNDIGSRRLLNPNEIQRGKSNTIEFLEHGWSGVFIEPIAEHITNELQPLLKKILTEEQYNRVQFVQCAASDHNHEMMLNRERYLKSIDGPETNIPYNWQGRRVHCRKTSDILTECKVPNIIDVMSIDVEGHELQVLSGMDFTLHLPKLIIIEHNLAHLEKIMELLPTSFNTIRKDNLNAAIINTNYFTP